MATIAFKGLREYEEKLSKLNAGTEEMIGKAIYEGAGVVADSVRSATSSIPVARSNQRGSEANKLDGITSKQKAGLLDGLGISKMRHENGYYNVKIGFDGYNDVKTKKYPIGQPNALIARSVIRGTSFRARNDFVSKAVNSSKKAAESIMAQTFDEEINKVMKG